MSCVFYGCGNNKNGKFADYEQKILGEWTLLLVDVDGEQFPADVYDEQIGKSSTIIFREDHWAVVDLMGKSKVPKWEMTDSTTISIKFGFRDSGKIELKDEQLIMGAKKDGHDVRFFFVKK